MQIVVTGKLGNAIGAADTYTTANALNLAGQPAAPPVAVDMPSSDAAPR